MTLASTVWGLNELGELVAIPGNGSTNVTNYLYQDAIPVDANGKLVIVGVPNVVVSSAAPNNADGRPEGTIYIQVP